MFSIQAHFAQQGRTIQPVITSPSTGENEAPQRIDFVPSSRIDELMQDKLEHFVEYMKQKSLYQTAGAELHRQYAHIALEKMLKSEAEITEMLYKAADAHERELIKQSFQNIMKSFV